jgi:O-antigen/teichoic acid export membrane protein
MSSLRKFAHQFSHFFTGMGLAQMLSLITFPILTRVLSKEQYGILGLVTTTMLIAVAISKAGLSDGIIRFYSEYSADPEKRKIFSSTVLFRGLTFSVIAVILYAAALPWLAQYLKIDKQFIACFVVMAFYLFIRPLNIIALNFLRVNGRTVLLNAATLGEKAVSVALSLGLYLYVFQDLYGFFIGIAAAEFILSLALFSWFFREYTVKPSLASRELASKLIKFGLPLLVGECAFLALSYADRYLILAYYDEAVLGVYTVGYNLAMYIANIIMFSISYSIVPIYVELYSKEGKEKTEAFMQRSMHYLILFFIPICFGYAAVSQDLFVTLASRKYASAAIFSPIILVGSIFFAMNSVTNAGLYIAKRSMAILNIMLAAVALKIGMNIVLLPKYGVMGAAFSTLVPCVMTTIVGATLAHKYIRVKIDLKQTFYYVALSACMYFIVRLIATPIVGLSLALKIIAGIVIVAAGTLYKEKEILQLVRGKLTFADLRVMK